MQDLHLLMIYLFPRRELLICKTKTRRRMLKVMINEVENCTKFSALGFYTIDRSTLTATLGTILTYFIVLYQTVTC